MAQRLTATVTGAGTQGGPRAPWLDNLRVVLIGGVIVAHAATAYIVEVSWYYEERTTSELTRTVVTFPVFMAAIFGLGPLFLVAGLMAARSVRGRGPAVFARTRLLRLGLPLLLFCLLIDPVADYLGDLAEQHDSLAGYLLDRTGTRDFGPMWFVAALLVFSLGYAAWRGLAPRVPSTGQVVTRAQLAGFAAAIAGMSWIVWLRWTYTDPTPFNANFGHWGQSAGLFALGVCAGERGWLETLSRRRVRRLGWIAVSGVVALALLAGYTLADDDFGSMAGGLHWQSVMFAAIAGVTGVAVALWVTSWFRRRWNSAGPVAQRAGRGSYAAYLIHPPVLVLASLACLPLPLPPTLKFLVVAAVGVPAAFTTGYALTRIPGLRRIL
jgi:glucan biosynthesis protein C